MLAHRVGRPARNGLDDRSMAKHKREAEDEGSREEDGFGAGAGSEAAAMLLEPPLKRLRLNEQASPTLSCPALRAAAAPLCTSSQPTTPSPSPTTPGYSLPGQPALSPQQRLPTIPEIHAAVDHTRWQHQHHHHHHHQQQQEQGLGSGSSAGAARPRPPLVQLAIQQQAAQQSSPLAATRCWGRLQQQAQQAQPQQAETQQHQVQQPLCECMEEDNLAPTSPQGWEATGDEDLEGEADSHPVAGVHSSGSRSCGGATPLEPAQQRRRVGEGGRRLHILEHIFGGVSDSLGGIPSVVLEKQQQPGMSGWAMGPPEAWDAMAVVPYVPPQNVVEEAVRRADYERQLATALGAWRRQPDLRFDNERPIELTPSEKPTVTIEELSHDDSDSLDALDTPEDMEADVPVSMEE